MRRGITSGHKWYQTLPEDWEERKLQYSSKVYSGGTPDRNNPDYWENGSVPWLTSGEINKKVISFSDNFITELALKESSTRWVKSGAVLMAMNGQGKTKATVALLEFDSTINQSLCSINLDEEHNNRFVFYFLEGRYSQIRGLVGEDREGLNLSTIKSIVLPLPPIETQKQIADFLDKETTRIDTLITKKKKQIELLQEKRQAIITQSVTKGLNENVKMKDSGVEWIGEIPEHWDIRKFSQVISIQEGQVDPSIEPYKSMILIAPNHIESKTGILLYTETAEEQGADSGKYLCREGDVVYSKIRPNLAKVVISPCDSLCSADMYPMRCDQRILENEFLYWLLLSDSYTRWAVLESMRVAMPKLNRETMSGYRIPVPSMNEQRKLISVIKEECSKISQVVEKIQSSIDLLKEYRSSLITHAVSGQIDITEFARDTEGE